MKKTTRLIAIFIIIAMIISNCYAILGSRVYATQTTYNLSFIGANAGNDCYQGGDPYSVIHWLYTYEQRDEHDNIIDSHSNYLFARIQKYDSDRGEWLNEEGIFSEDNGNQKATFIAESENINNEYRIVLDNFLESYNIFVNNQKITQEDYTIEANSVILNSITDGMNISIAPKVIRSVEFRNAVLDTDDSSNKTAIFNIDGKQVKAKVGIRSLEQGAQDYTFVPEELRPIEGNRLEASFEDNSNQFSGYFLKIENDENADIDLWVDGTKESIDDGWFSIAGNTTTPLNVEILKAEENQTPQNYEDIDVDVTFNDTEGEVIINNTRTPEVPSYNGTLQNAGYTDNNKTNKIIVNTSFGMPVASKVTINGTEYNFDPEGYDVPGASSYTIVVTGDTSIPTPKTIIWANPNYVPKDEEDAHWVADFTIKHGYARAIAVYDDQNNPVNPSEYTNGESDENGLNNGFGWVSIYPGSRVIFEFEPEYGYQLTDIKLNGQQIDNPTDIPNRFEFIMPNESGNVHFAANFEKRANTSSIGKDTSISNIKYTLDEGAINSGTAKLSIDKIDENNLTASQKEKFAKQAGANYEVSKYLDVDLTQIWYKGKADATDVWENEIYDLGNKKATITITLDKGISPDDVIILHEIHNSNGDVTGYETVKIKDKKKASNGIWTVTFETSKFSNYAIAKHNHNLKDEVTTKVNKATLSKNGSSVKTIITKCSGCKKEISRKTETTTIAYPKTISLSKTAFTYNKKVQKPTVTVKDSKGKVIATSNYTVSYSNKNSKNVGEYTVTIKFKGNYEGTKNLKYKINPKGVSISKLTKGSKSFKATWSKNTTQTTGYEIQYSTNKNFKSGSKTVNIKKNKTTSTTVKNLKKNKKYYVRIRTYKTVNRKKFYSAWSKVLNVKTK